MTSDQRTQTQQAHLSSWQKTLAFVLTASSCTLVFGQAATSLASSDGSLHIRARENYEHMSLELDGTTYRYRSFSHTFNIWYEKPYDYALGLATGPFVMSYPKANNQDLPLDGQLGAKIKFINHGIEFKKWFQRNFFLRAGLYYHQFNSHGSLGRDNGVGGLIGVGYEVDFEKIGLAFEFDYRRASLLKSKIDVSSKMFAIGVHFYGYI